MKLSPVTVSKDKQLALCDLVKHPGFRVLQEIMEKQVQEATVRIIQCKPLDTAEILSLQTEAHAINSYSDYLMANINRNVEAVLYDEEGLQEVQETI